MDGISSPTGNSKRVSIEGVHILNDQSDNEDVAHFLDNVPPVGDLYI